MADTELPQIIPLFPLPNVVLFPGLILPLHIFEPRYRRMVADLGTRSDPLVGMILLRGREDGAVAVAESPPIHQVGCAGRLIKVEALEDGRSNIVLRGVREFDVEAEMDGREYRQARVHWKDEASGGLERITRTSLAEAVESLAGDSGDVAVSKILADASISDEVLVNFLCYSVGFSAIERQALLESPAIAARAARLAQAIEFLRGAGSPQGGDGWLH